MKTCEECKRFYDDNCKMEIEIEEILEQVWEDLLCEKLEWMELRAKYCRFFK